MVLRVFLILAAALLRQVCTPWSFLGAGDLWDNVDRCSCLGQNLEAIVLLLLSQQCGEGRALTLLTARRSQLWWQCCG